MLVVVVLGGFGVLGFFFLFNSFLILLVRASSRWPSLCEQCREASRATPEIFLIFTKIPGVFRECS